MTFVDTSALYALLDRADQHHAQASQAWSRLLDSGEVLVTSNYVVVETCALVQHRLGSDAVQVFLEELLPLIEVRWVDRELHAHAVSALLAARRRRLSLVDCSSFALLRDMGSNSAFAFDKHFVEAGLDSPGQDDSITRR